MKNIFLGLMLFAISALSFSQEVVGEEKKISYRELNDSLSRVNIKLLKEGALLVRLQTKNKSIEALREIGENDKAAEIEKHQHDHNLSIINAFKTNFTFCPTYFFYSHYSPYIIQKQFDKVVFLNENLIEDSTIRFDGEKFLTAEFAAIEQDTAKYFSHYSFEDSEDQRLNKTENYYGSSDMGFEALIIKNDQFMQLKSPFPYYVRTFNSLPVRKSNNKTVKKMNDKLFHFLKEKQK